MDLGWLDGLAGSQDPEGRQGGPGEFRQVVEELFGICLHFLAF